MGLKCLLVTCFSLIPLVSGQGAPPSSMLNVLSTNPQLSALSNLVHSLPLLVQQFKSADNFTFLAPTDNAISSWLATNRSLDDIQATLQYHLLNGTFPSVSIPSTPIFVPTALTNQSYCNVTGGQRLKAWNDGNIKFGSALQTTSNAISTDLVVYGGIIHTIDKVLSLPIGPIQSFVAENLSYFIAIAEEGGYISGEAQAFVSKYLSQPNTTYFVFNSAKALADLNNTNVNKTMLLHSAGYGLAPQVIYSTSLVNGSQIITDLGLPVFVTVQDGDTYFNAAKVTSFDNFISNGVFHVIDDILNPFNITGRPPPAPSTSRARPTIHLSTVARSGIGVGAGVAAFAVIATLILLYRWKRSAGALRQSQTLGNSQSRQTLSINPGYGLFQLDTNEVTAELSANSPFEMPELETTESAVEVPARCGVYREDRNFF